LNPILSIITTIDLDHQSILGNSLTDIALEKAGIIKASVPCITIQQNNDVLDVLTAQSNKLNAPLIIASPENMIPSTYKLFADYQKNNLPLAKAALEILLQNGLVTETRKLSKGLELAHIPGRFQKSQVGDKTIIIDAAHNPSAVKALIQSLTEQNIENPAFLIGILKTKNAKEMLESISLFSSSVYYYDFEPGVSYSYKEICDLFPKLTFVEYKSELGLSTINKEVIVVTGSIYFIGNIINTIS